MSVPWYLIVTIFASSGRAECCHPGSIHLYCKPVGVVITPSFLALSCNHNSFCNFQSNQLSCLHPHINTATNSRVKIFVVFISNVVFYLILVCLYNVFVSFYWANHRLGLRILRSLYIWKYNSVLLSSFSSVRICPIACLAVSLSPCFTYIFLSCEYTVR